MLATTPPASTEALAAILHIIETSDARNNYTLSNRVVLSSSASLEYAAVSAAIDGEQQLQPPPLLNAPPRVSTFRLLLCTICIIGIAFNLLVFCKRTRSSYVLFLFYIKIFSYTVKVLFFRTRHTSATRVSIRLLGLMALADSMSLAALFVMLSLQYLGIRDPTIMTMICKVCILRKKCLKTLFCSLISSLFTRAAPSAYGVGFLCLQYVILQFISLINI